jgi:hypothetical protein
VVGLRMLGPVQLCAPGGVVELGPARQRAVLVALAVDAGRPVLTETLIDRVWDDDPPVAARAGLYSYLTRLRRLLAEAADVNDEGRCGSPPGLVAIASSSTRTGWTRSADSALVAPGRSPALTSAPRTRSRRLSHAGAGGMGGGAAGSACTGRLARPAGLLGQGREDVSQRRAHGRGVLQPGGVPDPRQHGQVGPR